MTSFKYGSTQGHWCYIGTDYHVHEIWWPTGGQYATDDLTSKSGAPDAAQGSALSAFSISTEEFVYFVSADGHVRLLYSTDDSSTWHSTDLTSASGAPLAASGTALSSFTNGTQCHVFYFAASSTNGLYNVTQLYGLNGSWTFQTLTAPGQGATPDVGTLASFLYGSSYRIYYLEPQLLLGGVAFSGPVQELYAESNGNGVPFFSDDLTEIATGSPETAQTGTNVVAFGFPPTASVVLYYRGEDGRHHEVIGKVLTNSWSQLSWTDQLGGGPDTMQFGFYW